MTPAPDKTLSDWLHTHRDNSQALPDRSRGWWILPSPARPRLYIPTEPALWKAALGLMHSRTKRRLTHLLLHGMRLARRPAHLHARVPCPLDEWLGELFPQEQKFAYAVYAGTPSLFVKDTVQCLNADGKILGFVKIPRTADAAGVVVHEAWVLGELASRYPGANFHPTVLGQRDGLCLQGPPQASPFSLGSSCPGSILRNLRAGWSESFPWEHSPVRESITKATAEIRSTGASDWANTLDRAVVALENHFGHAQIPHPMSHGDFIRWNILPGPFAFDWEWAAPRLPWHDAFHFLWMPAISSKLRIQAEDLWNLWNSAQGSALRGSPDPDPDHLPLAVSYLASQLAFYGSSSPSDGHSIAGISLLQRMHTMLDGFLKRLAESPHS